MSTMEAFEIAKQTLQKIVTEEVPFALAIRGSFKKNDVDLKQRGDITALLGCELRHHYLLDNLIERFCNNAIFEDTIYLRFLVANKLFLKRFDNDALYALACQGVSKEEVDNLLLFISSTNEIIPSEFDKTSPEYLSMRFNTPAWVIKMWQKQFGKGLVFKILKVNYRSSIPTVRVNNLNCSSQEILDKYPDFVASPVEDILIYNGRGTPKNLDEFRNDKIFFMKMATKYVLDRLEIEPLKGIAIYSDVPNNIYLDLIARFGPQLSADIIIHHVQSYFETKRIRDSRGYKNLRLYNAEASSIITCISNPVNTFICLPKSTTFDLFRSTPDYFLRIKQEKLDEFIAEETAALEECAAHVEVGGKLVYMVPTISKKESTNLIGNFLFAHHDYELVEEKQFFPFESFDSCLYYAILRKIDEPKQD